MVDEDLIYDVDVISFPKRASYILTNSWFQRTFSESSYLHWPILSSHMRNNQGLGNLCHKSDLLFTLGHGRRKVTNKGIGETELKVQEEKRMKKYHKVKKKKSSHIELPWS